MLINVACHGCRAAFKVPDHFAGRSGRCKRCGTPLDIPAFIPRAAPTPFVVTLDDDIGLGSAVRKLKRGPGLVPIIAGLFVLDLLALVAAVVLAGAGDGRPNVVVVTLALPPLAMLLYPLWLPAVLARRGMLSPGRWAAASALCFLAGGIALLFLSGSEMAERASEHPGTAEAIPVYVVGYLWAALMQGIPGCLLAAVVHKPRAKG